MTRIKIFLDWLISEIKSNQKSFVAFSFSFKKLNVYYCLFFALYFLIKPDNITKLFRVFLDESAVYDSVLVIPFVGLQLLSFVVFIPSFMFVLIYLLIDKDKVKISCKAMDFIKACLYIFAFLYIIRFCLSFVIDFALLAFSPNVLIVGMDSFPLILVFVILVAIVIFAMAKDNDMICFLGIILYILSSLQLLFIFGDDYGLIAFLFIVLLAALFRFKSIYLFLLSFSFVVYYFALFATSYFASSEGLLEPFIKLFYVFLVFMIVFVYDLRFKLKSE